MPTLTLQERIDALQEAYDNGVSEVEYADKKIKYRNLEEIERILEKLKAQQLGQTKISRRKYVYFNSGIYPDKDRG